MIETAPNPLINDARQTGVYRIRCTANGKVYVGSSSNSFTKRWNEHKKDLRLNKHHAIRLQRAWNKYGADAFVFEIVERTDPKHAVAQEQVFLDWWKAANKAHGFNSRPCANSALGTKLTAKQRAAISARGFGRRHSPETLKKIGDGNRGKVITPEMRVQIAKALTGLKASEETRKKQSLAHQNPSPETRYLNGSGGRGKPRTDEVKERIKATKRASFLAKWETFTEKQKARYMKFHRGMTPHQVYDANKGPLK